MKKRTETVWILLVFSITIAFGILASDSPYIAFALVGGFLGALAIAYSPFWGLVIFLFLEAFRVQDAAFFGGGIFTGAKLTILVTATVFALHTVVRDRVGRRSRQTPLDMPIFVFTLLVVFGAMRGGTISAVALSMFSLFALYYLVTQIVNDWRRMRLIINIWIAVTFLLLFSISHGDVLSLFELGTAGSALRFGGEFGNENGLALWLVLILGPVSARYFLASDTTKVSRHLIFMGFFAFILLRTGSRGGWLAGGIVIFTSFVLSVLPMSPPSPSESTKTQSSFPFRSILRAMLIMVVIWGALSQTMTLIERRVEGAEQGDLSFRVNEVQLLWDIFLDNPLFGVGISDYRNVTSQYSAMRSDIEYVPGTPHNFYSGLLAQFGLAGLMVYSWLVFSAIKATQERFGTADENPLAQKDDFFGLAASLVGYLVFAATHSSFTYNLLWFILGLFAATLQKDREIENPEASFLSKANLTI